MNETVIKTPEKLEQLIECLKCADDKTWLISGGTDLIIQLRKRNIYSGIIIDLMGIEELNYIKDEGKFIKIGSGTTLTEISDNDIVKKYAPALVQATSQVGSTQIRNRGTIAGNIGNSSPCADTVPPLMAMSAVIKIINGEGKIVEKSFDEVVIGSGRNNLNNDEVIIEIAIPKLEEGYISAFAKLGSRTAVTISKINAAAVVKLNLEKKIIEEARVFLGALGSKAFRSQISENALIKGIPSEQLLIDFGDALTKQVDTAIAGRKSQAYKREAVRGIAHDIFCKMFGNVVLGGNE